MKINNKDFISTKELSEKLAFSNEVIRWHIETYAKQDNLTENVDYAITGKGAMYLSATGIIWLTQKIQTLPYKEVTEILESVWEKKIDTSKVDSLEKKCFIYEKAIESMEAVMDELKTLNKVDTTNNKSTNNKSAKIYHRCTSNLPELTEEEKNFEKEVRTKIQNFIKTTSRNVTPTSILNVIYRRMRDVYGFVSEAEKKSLRDMFNIDKEDHISTLKVITFNETYRSIFMSLLDDYIGHDGKFAN